LKRSGVECLNDGKAALESPVSIRDACRGIERLACETTIAKHVESAVPLHRQAQLEPYLRQDLTEDSAEGRHGSGHRHRLCGQDRELIRGQAENRIAGHSRFGAARVDKAGRPPVLERPDRILGVGIAGDDHENRRDSDHNAT
jgi:hypothetical protein